MVLDEAVRAAEELRDALAAQVEEARGERALFRTLDAPALLSRAAARSEFNGKLNRLEGALRQSLAAAAERLGLSSTGVAAFASREPAGASTLSRALGEIRSLASALAELDRLNQFLARRALRVVQGYVNAIAPSPSAYDRRGLRMAASQRAVLSSRV